MKKLIFAGLAAILMIASCQKDVIPNENHEDYTQSLYIRLNPDNFAPATKAVTDARIADGAKFATPLKVYIFISDEAGNIKHRIPVATVADAANPLLNIEALKDGYRLNNIYKLSKKVQIVGNPKPDNFAVDMDATLKSMVMYNDVLNLVNDIQYDNDPTEIVLYGEGSISSTQEGDAVRLTADVALNPMVSRFQITLDYDDTVIKEVTFEGVYIRNFYQTSTFGNAGGGLNAQGSLEDDYTIDQPLFAGTYYSNMFDYSEAGLDTTKVFAYQFFPLTAPEIVVRYKAKNSNDNIEKLRFVRAKGFKDAVGNTFSNWLPGKLYNVDIVVGRGSDDPVGENVTLDVKITVGQWAAVNLTPVYQ
ncbi:MAG: hypothetical protein PHT64_02825 [Bacteroidales bacterium]|nr:hypothetical protein [Bacteroidales bacterium]MDD3522159.1 hypothetical protein [Bacteroidales bacterium]MDD4029975.1 hypothetical protein [Bacteroidales bacterium]MDD4434750.1 hypothetical protein [Bacteroidales bacterium]MDD5732713.1 hypothetical protein [Bacteroidales bacterium]